MARYIEVGELKEWILNWSVKNKHYHPYSKSDTIPIPELYDILEWMPTADVRENVHGVWQDKGLIDCSNIHMYQCSCCGFLDTSLHAFVYSFCPNCGAEMERSDNG